MQARLFAVPVLDKWLVHAPLDGVTAVVNRAALRAFPEELREAVAGEPAPVPHPGEGPARPLLLGLVPTRACNLSCAYCGFGATPQGERMDPGLAAAAVDWMADFTVRSGGGTLGVHFFGGEPLCAPEAVEAAVNRTLVAAAARGLRPNLGVTTNGVYSEARARFLGDRFNTVSLSFDGFRAVHDRHRPGTDGGGSFDRVAGTARVLKSSPAEVHFRVCVARDNVGQLIEIVNWFSEEFRPDFIDFETLQPTPESARAGLYPPDPYLFAAQFLKARSAARGHGVEAVYAAAVTTEPRISFCPVGNDTPILHPDGRVSACYLPERDWQVRGLDLNLGRLGDGGEMELPEANVQRVRELAADKPRCRSCFCRWSCAGGCHVNHSFPGCSPVYDDVCIQTRLMAACLLLEGLGLKPMADELTGNQASMERLALQPSDDLDDSRASP